MHNRVSISLLSIGVRAEREYDKSMKPQEDAKIFRHISILAPNPSRGSFKEVEGLDSKFPIALGKSSLSLHISQPDTLNYTR